MHELCVIGNQLTVIKLVFWLSYSIREYAEGKLVEGRIKNLKSRSKCQHVHQN